MASLKPEITQDFCGWRSPKRRRSIRNSAPKFRSRTSARIPTCGSTRWRTMPRSATAIATGRMRTTAKSNRRWSGMVVLQTRYRNGQQDQIKLGDELAPGQPFMRIVEPNSLLLDATMNQAESEDIRLGQKAVVRFDAFPDLVLHGHVTAVGAIAMSGPAVELLHSPGRSPDRAG